ncbi:MAG: ATP-binding protein, partial [Candidatus Sumerlaeia bacterium]|nr:ATP-binding protein [Candidatus Sumerlaeia bacterium]
EDLAEHILDIAENGLRAGATKIKITIIINHPEDKLLIEIKDNGAGISEALLGQIKDPFVTTRKDRKVGLGLALLNQACQESGGKLNVKSRLKHGTIVRAILSLTHIDRKPLGKLGDTLMALLLAETQPEINLTIKKINGNTVKFTFNFSRGKSYTDNQFFKKPNFLTELAKNINHLSAFIER